ncbi:21.7 kDa class VI heat shock protein [Rhododendron vialii]|uniref:21.7 kDa class VI heat shock protein n=1 Tax=Rhododendron vialii TaxID=182163 RepID=UPI00265D8D32|nr:21.7 kDa class VI heat shock protein [Rhododendron vialii]
MTSCRQLEVRSEDQTPQKWCVPLTEDVFGKLMSKGSPTVQTVFGDGSLFSPWLFGKFFDPSDAFPLWDFESDVLLSKLRSSSGTQSTVDWLQTGSDYVLKADLPGVGKGSVQVFVEHGKVVVITGLWKQLKESKTKDWRTGHWWEHGYVRRLELPENADWRKIEAYLSNDVFLEIKIPKKPLECDNAQGSAGEIEETE